MMIAKNSSAAALQLKWKPYPAYKDSDVEWLGDIPAHWRVSRIRENADVINGYPFDSERFTLGEGTPLVRIRDLYTNTTEVNYLGPVVKEALIENNDVLVGMDGDFNVARWRGGRALLNQRMCCVREKQDVDARLIAHLLPFPLKVINDLTYSTTVKHLSSLDVEKIRWGHPPLQEQRAIAAFLDRETAKIDTLVVKKEWLIELLQEKRAALITHAVTKGLDPSVSMKDSGVEWLGQIPVHWEVKRLKYLAKEPLKYGASEVADLNDPKHPRFIRITDIDEAGGLRDETFRSLPDEVARPYLLRRGDLLFARSGATVGKTFLYRESWGQACYAGYLIRFRSNETLIFPEFVTYFALSSSYWSWLSGTFIQATIQNVSAERYAGLTVCVPLLREQEAIVQYLDCETAKLDALIAKVRDGIEKLKEYRTALISAAVTGKIDVRQAV